MEKNQGLTREESTVLTEARILGKATDLPVYLSDGELLRLIAVIASDLSLKVSFADIGALPTVPNTDYFKIPLTWFDEKEIAQDIENKFRLCARGVPDFLTYFRCLCELHKRRKKFARINQTQPVARLEQISPRALLEFGIIPHGALPSWLLWRKWFFDIDNRSAQETGYLFEPILAAALGGVSYSAAKSPIRRKSDKAKGRQVDCIVDRRAYEFKLRVTIAASGQGRFAEELDFAADAQKSGFVPILLVLDPTPSSRLEELAVEFRKRNGQALVGAEAWAHLEAEAGEYMGLFVHRYVRTPILESEEGEPDVLDLSVSLSTDKSKIRVGLSKGAEAYGWEIPRVERRKDQDDDAPEE